MIFLFSILSLSKSADYCRKKGATTICILGWADVPFASDADYAILNTMDDFTPADADYLVLYMFTFSLMHLQGDFAAYEEFCDDLARRVPRHR